jgi:zinc transport system substrate-binding protein
MFCNMLNLYRFKNSTIMNKIHLLFILLSTLSFSCSRSDKNTGDKTITVSIAPFKYFVDEISGGDFKVNVMVPAGSNPHVYEPFPGQISRLRKSVAYISDGYLGFEKTWLDKFYETNKSMKKLSLGEKIIPLKTHFRHVGEQTESADPHFWVAPKCAMIIASSVRDLLINLYPSGKQKYETNYRNLLIKIEKTDSLAQKLFSDVNSRSFMIFHPNLGYLARDYGLEEISVEYEGKEPPPSRMKELIDKARANNLKTIFVQKEYDKKHAKAIADEIHADIKIIDPLSENWIKSTTDIIIALNESLLLSSK